MSDDVIVTDATIIERVHEGQKPEARTMRFPEMLLWALISILEYAVIRAVVVIVFSVPWLGSTSSGAAAGWLWLGTPLGVAVAAFLTLQTNVRNRQLHFVLTVVVFLSAVFFHINPTLGNPYIVNPPSGAMPIAWFLQAVAVLVGGGLGRLMVRRRRAKWASQQPALPSAG